MLINQGYHLVDLWQYLFGLPEALYADIPYGKYNDFAVDDEATLVMDYPGRMTGFPQSAWRSSEPAEASSWMGPL